MTSPSKRCRRKNSPAGANAFDAVKKALLTQYYQDGISEDDVYRAAVAGMLEHVDPRMRKWNKLLPPSELAEIKSSLNGEIIGIGASLDFDSKTGYVDVIGVIPNSPAEKAGLAEGNKIVTVNGKLYKGLTIDDVVGDIRGKAGEMVDISVLRGDKLDTLHIKRDLVIFVNANSVLLPHDVGLIGVHAFSTKTVPAVRAALDDLAKKGAKSIILDLRENQGGGFDDAVGTAELFLPVGAPIVSLKKRGEAQETIAAKAIAGGAPALGSAPIAILIDHGTASGAELVTAALHEDRNAVVIGARSFGKWSVQTVDDLANGYAIKYTLSLFYSPKGENFEGVGFAPDIDVTMDEKTCERVQAESDPEKRLAIDPGLRTAMKFLESR